MLVTMLNIDVLFLWQKQKYIWGRSLLKNLYQINKANKKRNRFAKQLNHFKIKRLYDRKKEQQMLHHSQAL